MVQFQSYLLAVVGLLAIVAETPAPVLLIFRDEFDKSEVVDQIHDDPKAKAFQNDLDSFAKKLKVLKPRDYAALFGNPSAKPAKTYAFPACERRGIWLSGLRYGVASMNKDHVDFHVLGEYGAIEAWYGIDGERPAAVLFYFKVDKEFPALDDAKMLERRLAWERDKFKKIIRHYEKQRPKAFVWEIDLEKMQKQYQGVDSADFSVKLKAWVKRGEDQGDKLDYTPPDENNSQAWEWHGKGGALSAVVECGGGGLAGKVRAFKQFYPRGGACREEFGGPVLNSVHWGTPDGKRIRYESGQMVNGRWQPDCWYWYDKNGNGLRYESDDNGDGIPDWVQEGNLEKKRLSVEKSWAIHPELIPKDCQVPQQEMRQVHIRRIAEPKD